MGIAVLNQLFHSNIFYDDVVCPCPYYVTRPIEI
jgi:hypothetical protein